MKNATRIATLILSVILISSVFVSCENASKNESTIIGKWSYVSHENTNTIEFFENMRFNVTTYQPVFSNDNKVESSSNTDFPTFPSISSYTACHIKGTYVIDGEKITLTDEETGIKQISTFAVNSTTLTITTGGTETSGIKTVQSTIVLKRTN